MSIHTNENGALKNTAADGSRVAIRMWPLHSSPYYASYDAEYYYSTWVDPDRPYLTITNPSVDYIWPFVPDYIIYIPFYLDTSCVTQGCIIRQGAEPITKPVGSGYGGWLSSFKPDGGTGDYWVYGDSGISLSGNAMTVTYFNINRSKDNHSPDDHRQVCGTFIAVAE